MLQPETVSAVYNSDTDLMFPLRVIPNLRGMRGDQWKALIDELCAENAPIEALAGFTLMMVKLGGCQGCSVDSYRGMRGCTQCARQTIRRFRGSDQDLLRHYQQCKSEVERYLHRP
jgi:hypothetical protein